MVISQPIPNALVAYRTFSMMKLCDQECTAACLRNHDEESQRIYKIVTASCSPGTLDLAVSVWPDCLLTNHLLSQGSSATACSHCCCSGLFRDAFCIRVWSNRLCRIRAYQAAFSPWLRCQGNCSICTRTIAISARLGSGFAGKLAVIPSTGP